MADALSRKAQHSLNIVVITQLSLLTELEDSNVQIVSFRQTNVQLLALYFLFNCYQLPYSPL